MEKDLMSKAEWQVMRVLWAKPGSTSAQVIAFLSEGFNWQAVTVKTLLGRLKAKNLVVAEKIAGKYRYTALVNEQEQLVQGIKLLQSSICNTKQVELVSLLLDMGEFSQGDLDIISQLAQQKKENAPEHLTCRCIKGQCTCGQNGDHCHG